MQDFLDSYFLDNTIRSWLSFLGIVVALIVLSPAVSRLINEILFRFFKRFSTTGTGASFHQLLSRPVKFILVLSAIAFAIRFLEYPEPFEFNIGRIPFQRFLWVIFRIAFAIAVTLLLLRMVEFISRFFAQRASLTANRQDDQFVWFLSETSKVIIVILSIIFIMGVIFNLNVTGFLAGAGIAGIAIALAAKESLENLLGSFTIFFEKPFTVGDFIQVGEVTGTVERVGFRSTRIRTPERSYITLPNRRIIDSHLDNLTLRNHRRIRFFIGVQYDTTSAQLKKIIHDLQALIDEHNQTNEEGIIALSEFGDSSINILIQYYLKTMEVNELLKVKEAINFAIMEIIEKHKASFAFPTRTVHLFNEK